MNILMTGASGFIGSYLVPYLQAGGHTVTALPRMRKEGTGAFWDPEKGIIELPAEQEAEGVIHLAGENIATGRWTGAKKERIRRSRVDATLLLSREIARLDSRPRVLLSASGIGIYGDQGERVLTEDDPPGQGFLVDVCREWEAATRPAQEAGLRVVHMRIAPVLALDGGMLARMLPLFRLGLGASLGPSTQYMSWILIDDILRAIDFLLSEESLEGPVNLCAPDPVTSRDFTRALGRALHRPATFRIPSPLLRIMFGQIADEELLSSTRAVPRRLLNTGFDFDHPLIEEGLKYLLGSGG